MNLPYPESARVSFRGQERHHAGALREDRSIISVFGSSNPQPGDAAYEEAYLVGQLLAEKGFVVATGGYNGTMTAVSEGAAKAGGYAIGVTCDQIEQFRPLGPNPWIHEEIRYPSLQDRLIHLVRYNDGMIVLPGGIGTLSEMALAWSFLQVGVISLRPLALLGSQWRQTIQDFMDPRYVRPTHGQLLFFGESPAEVTGYIAAQVPAGV